MKTDLYKTDAEIQEKLNILLSDYQMFYQNMRAFHWLVKGPQFYQMHAKFEALYNQAAETIDEIAERILMIGGVPLHHYEDYLKTANLKAVKDPGDFPHMLNTTIENLEYLLGSFRELIRMASEKDDEGTTALISELIGGTEKELWMLRSYLS